MRVLFLSTWYPFPPDNGSKLRAYYLLRALAGDHHVSLVAFQPDGQSRAGGEPPSELSGVKVYPVPVDPFRYTRLPRLLTFASPVPLAFWPARQMERTVERLKRTEAWDVVVAVQVPAARYACLLPEVPGILDVDTALSYQLHERYSGRRRAISRLRGGVSSWKARRHEARMCRRFSACVVASPDELDHVQAMVAGGGNRVEVVPNGVDCRHNRPDAYPRAPKMLVFNGSLTYSANYDAMRFFLAEVYPLIRAREPGVTLAITGSAAGVDVAGLPQQEGVRLTGYLEDVRPAVGGASVCVVPMRQGGGTRLKILEAMALGTPVVSTHKGAEGLEVTAGEDILLADEAEEFAGQVLRLLREPVLHQAVAANARRLVETQYDWETVGQRFAGLVETVARENPA